MPPTLDATDATRAYLLHKFPANRERVMLAADAKAEGLLRRRHEAATREKLNATAKREFDAELMAIIGDHDGIEGEFGRMTWKLDKNGVRRPRFTARSGGEE
jgi:hypothetical protein